jgi:hypothetical protein
MPDQIHFRNAPFRCLKGGWSDKVCASSALQYDYRTGGEHKKKRAGRHKDASGSDAPYDPDWGNYGARCSFSSL